MFLGIFQEWIPLDDLVFIIQFRMILQMVNQGIVSPQHLASFSWHLKCCRSFFALGGQSPEPCYLCSQCTANKKATVAGFRFIFSWMWVELSIVLVIHHRNWCDVQALDATTIGPRDFCLDLWPGAETDFPMHGTAFAVLQHLRASLETWICRWSEKDCSFVYQEFFIRRLAQKRRIPWWGIGWQGRSTTEMLLSEAVTDCV